MGGRFDIAIETVEHIAIVRNKSLRRSRSILRDACHDLAVVRPTLAGSGRPFQRMADAQRHVVVKGLGNDLDPDRKVLRRETRADRQRRRACDVPRTGQRGVAAMRI